MSDADSRQKLHADIAHPICTSFGNALEATVIKAYQEEKEWAGHRTYESAHDTDDMLL